MSQTNLWIKPVLIVISLGVVLGLITFFVLSKNTQVKDPSTFTALNWMPDETIKLNYDKCKDLNRSLAINRLFKKDFRLPMCPQGYVVLYDKSQEIVFIFNEELQENPTLLTIDVACDNSTGKC